MTSSYPVSVAPMMGYTDRHARYLYRLISPRSILYTEMVTSQAIVNGNAEKLLHFHVSEHPLVLQIGGSDPKLMARAAQLGQRAGYDQVNINVGCPSDRVQSGAFGACLMADPVHVAEIFSSMQAILEIPVTIKNRIGIDQQDSIEDLNRFVDTVASAGCMTFIIHARKAWLKGLSPKQNRDVPPLDYQRVYRVKAEFPQLNIIINGGITTVEQVESHLQHTDGVMLGREISRNPWLLAELDNSLAGSACEQVTRADVVQQYSHYIQQQLELGVSIHALVKPLSGLFNGVAGARAWRRMLADTAQGRAGEVTGLLDRLASFRTDTGNPSAS